MATKLQELLEELKELRKWDILEGDEDMDFDIIERPAGEFIKSGEILQLIAKYTKTTPTYKLGDSDEIIEQETLKLYNEMFNNPYEEEIGRRDILEYGKRVIKAVAEKNLNQ